MKKTFNINLAGYVFIIDEDAYELLRNYLDTLHNVFDAEADNAELMADLELRMAEILGADTEGGTKVITVALVEQLIARMGRPEELIDEATEIHESADGRETEEESKVRIEESTPPPPPPLKRRLLRDPNNNMIGGVCAGLAAYLGMDPTWVRLIAVVLALLSFSTLCAIYIVLWIVVPVADTPLKQMQMRGESPTMENIGRNVTGAFRSAANSVEDVISSRFSGRKGEGSGKRFADGLVSFFGFVGRVLAIIMIFLGGVIEIGLAVGFVVCLFVLLLFLTPFGPLWIDSAVFESYEYHTVVATLLGAIGVILAIGIPLFALLWVLLKGYGPKRREMSTAWKAALSVAWVISFILSAFSIGYIVNHDDRRSDSKEERTVVYDTVDATTDSTVTIDETVSTADSTAIAATATPAAPAAGAQKGASAAPARTSRK